MEAAKRKQSCRCVVVVAADAAVAANANWGRCLYFVCIQHCISRSRSRSRRRSSRNKTEQLIFVWLPRFFCSLFCCFSFSIFVFAYLTFFSPVSLEFALCFVRFFLWISLSTWNFCSRNKVKRKNGKRNELNRRHTQREWETKTRNRQSKETARTTTIKITNCKHF